jgi:hypothetical protein
VPKGCVRRHVPHQQVAYVELEAWRRTMPMERTTGPTNICVGIAGKRIRAVDPKPFSCDIDALDPRRVHPQRSVAVWTGAVDPSLEGPSPVPKL